MCFIYDAILMTLSWPPGVFALDVSAWFPMGGTPSRQTIVVSSALCIKQIKNIMKYHFSL